MRMILLEILRALGCRDIFQAEDGAQAIQVVRTHNIDIVITDLMMRPMDGVSLIRALRNAPDSPNRFIPIIMVTGHTTQSRVAEARDAGVNEFLAKPITGRGVLDRIRRVIASDRSFVNSNDYFGPDRRRRNDPLYGGPFRRATDGAGRGVVEL
jgi:two-component system, chemotaxis family, chemotaxis protein CheY